MNINVNLICKIHEEHTCKISAVHFLLLKSTIFLMMMNIRYFGKRGNDSEDIHCILYRKEYIFVTY